MTATKNVWSINFLPCFFSPIFVLLILHVFKDEYFRCFTSHLWFSPYCGLDFHHSEVLKMMVSHNLINLFSWDFSMMWGTEPSFILDNSCQNEIEQIGGGFCYFLVFIPGEMIQFDIFWMGWFNHQRDEIFSKIFRSCRICSCQGSICSWAPASWMRKRWLSMWGVLMRCP